MILEVFTTGLRKLGSTGKKSFEKYNESFFLKTWPWQTIFIFSYFFLSKQKNLTNDAISTGCWEVIIGGFKIRNRCASMVE